ncbi:unnamed protein product [Rhodiola kirilowii]
MTPFEAVYGRQPPSLMDYTMGKSHVGVVDSSYQPV